MNGIKKLGLVLVLVVLSMSISTSDRDTIVTAQTQDWSMEIGEQFNIMNTITWSRRTEYGYGTTLVNGWSFLSAESHPLVGVLESWNDIPHPNETIYSSYTGDVIHSVFDAVYNPPYNIFQGQNQSWFNFFIPYRNTSVFENLLDTLTQGPWNHSITPEFFMEHPSYWGYRYSFSHEEFFYNASVTYWITAGYDVDEHYSGVIREGWVTVYNGSSGEEVHMRRIRCSPSGPRITSQSFYHAGEWIGSTNTGEYTEGQTGNIINWGPLFLPTGFTCSYGIHMNGSVVVPEQTHMMSPHWTTLEAISMNYSVDGLSPGLYNFTLIVKDYTHATHTLTFWLIVHPYTYTREILLGGIGTVTLIGIGLYLFNRNRS